MKQMTRIAVALGSNLGNREQYLAEAAARLVDDLLLEAQFSHVYESAPWGVASPSSEPKYLNAVAIGETDWKPPAIVNYLKNLERDLGRTFSAERNTSRTIDLDLLAYGDHVWESDGVVVPHPRLHERAFVLLPWNQLWPQWRHPRLGQTVAQLLSRLPESERLQTKAGAPLQPNTESR